MSEQMRSEFEVWLEQNSMFPIDGPRAAGYWSCWQASRAALCVELPLPVKRAFHEYDLGYNEALDHCEEAIHAAGVKTR